MPLSPFDFTHLLHGIDNAPQAPDRRRRGLLKISVELLGRLEKHSALAIAAMNLESTPCSSECMHPRVIERYSRLLSHGMLARDTLATASSLECNAIRDRERSLIYSHRYEKAKSGNPFALHARDDKRAVVSSEALFKKT